MPEQQNQASQNAQSQTGQPPVVSKQISPAGDAFISPRVLDQNAYDQFSSELRSIMDETASRAEALRQAAVHADKTCIELSEATNTNREQLALTAKLLKALNAKAESVESTLTNIETRSVEPQEAPQFSTEQLNQTVQAVVDQALANALDSTKKQIDNYLINRIQHTSKEVENTFNERLDTLVDNALSAAAEERIISAVNSIESQTSNHVQAVKNSFESLSEAADERLSELERRSAIATRELEDRIKDAKIDPSELVDTAREGINAQVQEVLSEALGPALAKLKGTANSLNEALNIKAQHAVSNAKQTVATVRDETVAELTNKSTDLNQILEQAHTAQQELKDELHRGATMHIVRMRETIEDATKLLGYDPTKGNQPPEAPAKHTLEHVVRRALASRDSTQELIRRLDAATGEAQVRADDIEESVLSAVNIFNDLLTKKGELDRVIADAMKQAQNASVKLSHQKTQSENLLTPIVDAQQAVEQLSKKLDASIQEGRTIAQIADQSRDELTSANATATQAIANLGPWKRLLIDAEADAPLPEGLQHIADKFRDEIGRPLIKMASAMNMLAAGADAAFQPTKDGAQIVISQQQKPATKPKTQTPQMPNKQEQPTPVTRTISPVKTPDLQAMKQRRTA